MSSAVKAARPLLLVVNPHSGTGTAKLKLCDVISLLSYKGFCVSVYPTRKAGTAQYIAENIEKYDRIVVCGGDGTLSDVLAGAAFRGSKVPVALIPMGSTNDFARNLRIPKNSVLATLIAAGNSFSDYDIGSLNGKPFSYIAAVGAFTEVSYSAPQTLKNTLGHFAYVLEGAKSIANIKPIRMDINCDGRRICGDFLYASVSNTYSVGGMVMLDKKSVKLDDGVFELLLVKQPKNNVEAAELVVDIASNRMKSENIFITGAKNVDIRFAAPAVFSLDGEKSKEYTDVSIRNCRRKVRLVVPNRFYELTNYGTKFQT